jgi:hypothetical protein
LIGRYCTEAALSFGGVLLSFSLAHVQATPSFAHKIHKSLPSQGLSLKIRCLFAFNRRGTPFTMSRFCSFFVTLSLFCLGNASTAVFTTTFPDTYVGLSLNISWKGALPPSNITLEKGSEPLPDYQIVSM